MSVIWYILSVHIYLQNFSELPRDRVEALQRVCFYHCSSFSPLGLSRNLRYSTDDCIGIMQMQKRDIENIILQTACKARINNSYGCMDDLRLCVLLTVFQSYQDDIRVIIKDCAQNNLVHGRKDFHTEAELESGTARSAARS